MRTEFSPQTRWVGAILGLVLLAATLAVTEYPIGQTAQPWFEPIIAVALVALALVAWRYGLQPMPRLYRLVAVCFFALMGYAVLSALLTEQLIGPGPPWQEVPLRWVLPPVLQGAATCLCAALAIAIVPARELLPGLWWASAVAAVLTPLGWLIVIWGDALQTERLSTRLGGAAVLHVALLLGLAVCWVGRIQRYYPRTSLILCLAYAGFIVLSQTRAGLMALGIFGFLMASQAISRTRRRVRAIGLVTVAAGIFAAAVWFVLGERGTDASGGGRWQTWVGAWRVATSSIQHFLVGSGYGTLWPWHAFERASFAQSRFLGPRQMPHGTTLAHAHNLYVAVGAELGLLGLGLLFALVVTVLWCWKSAQVSAHKTLAAGLVATLVAFCFDTYLIKNYPVSLVWWCVLFATIVVVSSSRQPRETVPSA